ncbi:cupin domain-containing protein [Thermoflavimicrobium dichotomicum]|uniref:ChrR Cupin-like domain-containing protein n=1 Tax=Thermoflavimicrobium dichotomicum TaxID=46223 RepID=A0A1I3MPE9_9BACL|nr:cupin domain-containing protein [Thermoflavimicrobium dichotomicum]SFI98801.1 ChrR Cupin-like domain-containing protein [Thermoflavimicrobium dichotomicum]
MNKPYIIRYSESDRIPMGQGVKISYLRKSADEYSILLQMDAHSQFPVHEHVGGEEIFVVEGEVQVGEEKLNRGDYYYLPPGFNRSVSTDKGCTLLISSAKGVQLQT